MTTPDHPDNPTEPVHPTVPPGAPAPVGAPTPHVAPPPSGGGRNTLAIVALVVALLGTVFALIHGAMIVGWVLLPVAFVLSVVALAQHGRPKGMAVAALVVSIVGTIVGVVAFMGALGDAVDDAFNTPVSGTTQSSGEPGDDSGATTGSGDGTGTGDATAADDGSDEGSSDPEGSRANPYPMGSSISSGDWTVTVNSFTPDATDQVLAANEFNEAPAGGNVYALANVTITYTGDASGYALETTTDFVTSGGNVVGSPDSMVVAPDPLGLDELYPGASVTGNLVFEIPSGDGGLLRVRPGILADEAFVALS